MFDFGWDLIHPSGGVPGPEWETFASGSEDWESDYSSQVIMGCEYLELHGYVFQMHGFGRGEWPVTVGYDLSTILESLPDALESLGRGDIAVLDMYAPGTDAKIQLHSDGGRVELICSSSHWTPDPDRILAPAEYVAGLVQMIVRKFAMGLSDSGSPLAQREPFSIWQNGRVSPVRWDVAEGSDHGHPKGQALG